jgi:hypothetical protein
MAAGISTGISTGISIGASAAIDALDRRPLENDENKVVRAATDFEALLLGQILRSSHGDSGWLGADEDDADSAAVSLGEEQLARAMAASGGVGLSKLIESGIRNRQRAENSESTAPRAK